MFLHWMNIMFSDEEMQQQEEAAAQAEQEQMAQMPPPVDPLEAELTLNQQKIDGDLAKEQLKFDNTKDLKALDQEFAMKQAQNQAVTQDLQSLLQSYLNGGALHG